MKRFAITCSGNRGSIFVRSSEPGGGGRQFCSGPHWGACGRNALRDCGIESATGVLRRTATTACLRSELLLDARQTGVGWLPRDLVQAAHSSFRLI